MSEVPLYPMVVLGGARFLMREVPLWYTRAAASRCVAARNVLLPRSHTSGVGPMLEQPLYARRNNWLSRLGCSIQRHLAHKRLTPPSTIQCM